MSVAGGALGIVLARWGVMALAAQLAAQVPVHGEISLDASVLLFALAVTLGAGVLFGSAPAWQYSRADVHDALTVRVGAAGPHGGRFGMRSTLVAAQIALSVVLLVSAGLLTRSLVALSRVEPGFDFMLVNRGPHQPIAQQTRAHPRASPVDHAKQRVFCIAACGFE